MTSASLLTGDKTAGCREPAGVCSPDVPPDAAAHVVDCC